MLALVVILLSCHWRSFHYAVTHLQNKNSSIQGRSPVVVKLIFHTIRNCSSSGSEFFPLEEIPILNRGAINENGSLPLMCVTFSPFWVARCLCYVFFLGCWSVV